jgi:protein-tyrosine phosphatase
MAGFIPPFPNDFKYLVINALDNENNDLSDNFKSSNEFIENALDNNGKVLIHCMAGRSRSATILIAYLIDILGMDVDNILLAVQNKRKIVQPNSAFMKQLRKYHSEKFYSGL